MFNNLTLLFVFSNPSKNVYLNNDKPSMAFKDTCCMPPVNPT